MDLHSQPPLRCKWRTTLKKKKKKRRFQLFPWSVSLVDWLASNNNTEALMKIYDNLAFLMLPISNTDGCFYVRLSSTFGFSFFYY